VNFQQLKIIREAARRDFNLTEVANMLYTSQSGVSRHIRELEEELGIEIFIRRGKRLLGMTEPGKALLTIAERILNEASNVRRLADLFTNDASGVLTIATTHTQARYSLPPVIKVFRELFPEVRLELIQGTPQEIEVLLQNGGADIGIASERLSNDPLLVAFPWFRWHHSLLLPSDHPLNQVSPLTLDAIGKWPLITYRQGITGRSRIDEAFNRKGITPDVVLSAQDSPNRPHGPAAPSAVPRAMVGSLRLGRPITSSSPTAHPCPPTTSRRDAVGGLQPPVQGCGAAGTARGGPGPCHVPSPELSAAGR